MKKIFAVFILLLSTFFITWGIKLKTPINRPDNVKDEEELPWYESRYSSPVADEGWYLDPTIPDNYVPVPGEEELYMVVDDSGTIIGYRHRYMEDDGSWAWEDVNPDIPDNYELVEGTDNLYRTTNENGEINYFLYIRNEDDTYCFVETDEFGTPYYDGEDAEVIANNYIHEDGNTYAVYNDNGVKEGYAQRQKDSNGNYVWKKTDKPVKSNSDSKSADSTPGVSTTESESGYPDVAVISGNDIGHDIKVTNGDGTYTVTNKSTNTVTENGYNVMYETTVYNTYDSNGKLISTKQDGPYEISRIKADATATPNTSLIEATLDKEYSRVASQVTYNTEKANKVLTKLNAERANQGLSPLKMDSDSEAYKLACIRAADMAIYNYSAVESPMYGTLDDMVSRWNCSTANASENVWKAGKKNASDIHTRFQAYDGSRNIRMSSDYIEVGIAIVEQNGQTYIAEVYLK